MLFQVSCLHDMAVPDKSILAEALSTQKQMYMDVEREKKTFPKTLKYWIGAQQGWSYVLGRRCLLNLG